MKLHGACHCEDVAFELDWPDGVELVGRACGCTFCRKHGGVWTANPAATLAIEIRDGAQVSRYTFATGTAEFLICARCGVVPAVTSRIGGVDYAVISVNALAGIDRDALKVVPASFDGEDTDARLARRTRGWIPNVTLR